jgi:soluble lytic murein transglycosylase-like protein
MISRILFGCACAAVAFPVVAAERASLDALISQHAKARGVPESLVHHVVRRESNYNPRAANRGNYGLMQIRHATARGLGYTGSAVGLLDANTNLTYAVAYLANAYRVAGGNERRAVSLYQRGYYYEAKRKGLQAELRTAAVQPPAPAVQPAPALAFWLQPQSQPVATAVDATGSVIPAVRLAAEPAVEAVAPRRRARVVRARR